MLIVPYGHGRAAWAHGNVAVWFVGRRDGEELCFGEEVYAAAALSPGIGPGVLAVASGVLAIALEC